jgi:hypothetical protein
MRDDPLAIPQGRHLSAQGLLPIAVISQSTGLRPRVIASVANREGWPRGASPRIRTELTRIGRLGLDPFNVAASLALTHDLTGKPLDALDLARLQGAEGIGARPGALAALLDTWLFARCAPGLTPEASGASLRRLGGLAPSQQEAGDI